MYRVLLRPADFGEVSRKSGAFFFAVRVNPTTNSLPKKAVPAAVGCNMWHISNGGTSRPAFPPQKVRTHFTRPLHSPSRVSSSCSQLRASPDIPVNLEQIALLVWKTDLAFLVEPRLLKIVGQPIDVRMPLLIWVCTYFSLSTRGSSITLSVRLSASQQ